jgi:hypothetical protein
MCVHAPDNGPAPISYISVINGPLSGEKNGRLLALLGVTLDRYLSFAPQIWEVRNRAYFVLGRLFHLINKRSKMSLRNKRTQKKMIYSIGTYY